MSLKAKMAPKGLFKMFQNEFCSFPFPLENHCTHSAVIVWWLQLKSAQNIVSSCEKGQYFGQYFTFENIHCELLSLINPAVYLLNKIFVGAQSLRTEHIELFKLFILFNS